MAVPDEVDQLGHEGRTGAGPPWTWARLQNRSIPSSATPCGDADEARRAPPGPRGGSAWFIASSSRRLHHAVGAEAVGELLDRGNALVAARFDDVGGAELAGQALPALVAAHGDDPLGPEPLGGEHGAQPDRAVADHGDRLARPASAATAAN